jgi:hypothetical protein
LSYPSVKGKWYSIKIHLLCLFLVFIINYVFGSPSLTLLVGGLITFITYIWIGFYETKRTPVWFSPLSFYFLWYSVGLGLSGIYYGILLLAQEKIFFVAADLSYESVADGFIIYLIGSFCLHAGLQRFRPVYENKERSFDSCSRFSLRTILILVIISLLYSTFNEFFAVFGGLINFLNYGLIAAVSLLALTSPEKLCLSDGMHKILIVAGCIGIFLLNISTTSKAFMMFSFLPLFWYLIMDRRRIKYLVLLFLAAIPFYMFIVYPVSWELRGQSLSGEGINETEAFGRVLAEDKRSVDRYRIEEDPFIAYLSRLYEPVVVSYIYEQVEQYGYAEGATMAYAAYAFIPRLFWPDKPGVTQGGWFAYYALFGVSSERSNTSLGITAIGELFWNFGITGVIVGMFFIGALFGGLWRLAGIDPRDSVLSMLLYINLLFFMPAMAEAVTVFVGVVIFFLAFKTLFKLSELFVKK